MSEEQQYKAFILQAIDQLRQRKARPDFERICHIVSRRQGLAVADVETQLNKLVSEGSVAKVDYKGNTSYRNMAKWKWNKQGRVRRVKVSLKTRVLTAFKALLTEKNRALPRDSEQGQGVADDHGDSAESSSKHVSLTLEEIEEYLARGDAAIAITGNAVCSALDRLIADRVLSQVSQGEYALMGEGGEGGRRFFSAADGVDAETEKPGRSVSQSPSSPSGASSADDNSQQTPTFSPAVIKLPARRGRPPGSGKGKKRTLPAAVGSGRRASVKASKKDGDEEEGGAGSGEEWRMVEVEPGEDGDMSNDSNTTIVDARCDFCQMTAAENQRGISEPLLFCKDCPAKAHPSCMDYSDELARRARRSPWQCMECKTCSLCSDAGDPDTLLFCDACDKGYHMTCHQPPLTDKPQGKWECQRCEQELKNRRHSEILYQDDNIGLPTPRQSPVQFRDGPISRKSVGKSSTSSASPPLTTPAPPPVPDASGWTVADVVQYFTSIGFENDAHVFHDQDIDGKSMLLMRRQDVVEGLSLKLGIALKMFARIQRLQDRGQNSV